MKVRSSLEGSKRMVPRLAPTLALGMVVGVLIGQRLPSQLGTSEGSAGPNGMASNGLGSPNSNRRLLEVQDGDRRKLSSVTEYFRDTDVSLRSPKEDALVNLLDVVFPGLRDIDFSLPVEGYYINLDRSVERRSVMERTFGKIWGGRFHRHRGVDYKNHTQVIEVLGGGPKAKEVAEFNAVNIAAILSHLTAVKRAYLSGAEAALITEDDIGPYLMPYWTVGIDDVLIELKNAKVEWDTVMLWWATESQEGTAPPKAPQWVGENLIRSPYLWGGSAYLISRQGMEKVMRKHFPGVVSESTPCVLTFEGDQVIDGSGYYGSLMTHNYIAYPGMFITHSKQSTIQTVDWHTDFHQRMGAGHWWESVKRWQSKYLAELK